MGKPNIIFILADQLRRQSVGYAGDRLARTPNIDGLAAGGMSFDNAVASMPVCSAYRASLFTGKYATSTGMVINELRLNPDHHPRTLARCLSAEGYELGYIGKWHLWAAELGNHDDPQNSFTPRGPHRLGFDGLWAAYNFHHRYYGDNAYYHTESPEKIHFDAGVFEPDGQTDMAIRFIEEASAGDDPFALVLSVGTPHDPWDRDNVPAQYYEMWDQSEFGLPPNWRQEPDEKYGDLWSNIHKTPELLAQWMHVYYAMVANLDWNVGRIVRSLDTLGITEDTIVVFTSDHGECFGAHGRMKKNIFYEEAARVPLLVSQPGRIPAGHRSNACITNVDLLPTLLGLVDAPQPPDVEGANFSAEVVGGDAGSTEPAFLQNTGACALWEDGHEWRAVRTDRHTYGTFRVDGSEWLYDNHDDPYQMINLAQDPGYGRLRASLRGELASRMQELQDNFEVSTFYRDHWVDDHRRIVATATSGSSS